MSGRRILPIIALVIVVAAGGFLVWNNSRVPQVLGLDAGLEKYLIDAKACSSPADCARKLGELEFLRSEKTNYCCVVKYKSDVYVNETWYKCRGLREPNGTLGRLAAEYKCRGFNISYIDGDKWPAGWGIGTEFARDLEVEDCKDEPRCTNDGKTPWSVPVCNDGDSVFVKRVDCLSGYWEQYNYCENGKWVRKDLDSGCISTPGGIIK